jgi:hypothetical protein
MVGAAVMFIAAGAWSVGVMGQQRAAAPPPQLADEVFTNIQILKGMPLDQFVGTMGFFAASLGLNCIDCHVEDSGGNWAKYADDNNLKRTSRRMMLMVNTINQANFGGRQVVTCNTCHRGSPRPSVMPSLDQLYASPPPDEPGDPSQQAPGQPSIERLLDRYFEARGGRQRIAALTTFTAKGSYIGFDDADKSSIEMFARMPGQYSIVAHTPSGDITWTVAGQSAWIGAPLTDRPVPVMAITGGDLDGAMLEADVFIGTRLGEGLTNWRIGFPVVIDDREANVAQATAPNGATVTFCFDAETGLLLRQVRFVNTPVGRVTTRIDYSNYRDVNGVKLDKPRVSSSRASWQRSGRIDLR